MASKKFDRKIREVAAQVMAEGEEFRAGLAGQAGSGGASQVGGQLAGAEIVRAGGVIAGKMFNALVILGDRNVYLIRTPRLSAWKVEEVVIRKPVGTVPVHSEGPMGVRIGDYRLTYTFRMAGDAKQLVELIAANQV